MASTLADRPRLPRRLTYRRKQRHGIILLMVVSLLALFLLMGVTFAILAIQYKTAADTQAAKERYGDPAVNEMEMGLDIVVSDSVGRSALKGHSLLRDLYGTDYVQSTVTVQPSAVLEYPRKSANGQFLVFGISTTPSAGSLSDTPGFYNARVITFITGPAAGISTRIAGYDPFVAGGPELYVEQLVGDMATPIAPNAGDMFVINGAPFNGMGFGYDPGTWRLDAVDGNNRPVSLLPHFAGYTSPQINSSLGVPLTGDLPQNMGGADEPWDAPDLQNLHISVVPPGLLASGAGNVFSLPLIPSFHRPELVNYWLDPSRWPGGSSIQLATDANQRHLARSIIFRPMPWDHPNFTGSNPDLTPSGNTDAAYDPIMRLMAQQGSTNSNSPRWQAIWDVDNDGDGIRESVWVDLGLPVMTSASGRRYKRLYAILIKDLDGRINLNVHGNFGQARVSSQASIDWPFHAFSTSVQPPTPPALPMFPHNRNMGFTATRQLQLPRGMGFGPAEVDFRWVLGISSPPLTADYGPLLTGRYGDGQPGVAGVDDPFSAVKMAGVPGIYLGDSWYGSIPDVWGRNAVAVDFGGRPFFFRESISASAETVDDPYEMQWDPATAISDEPYSVADMERLARANDSDIATFPARLPNLSTGLFNGAGQPSASPASASFQRLRESFTTMGSHVPTLPAIMRPDHRQRYIGNNFRAPNAVTVFDLYRQKYLEGGGPTIATNPGQLRSELAKIMPWEFWQGKPLDLNRYLSNGLNDNASPTNQANGEPIEAALGETAFGTDGSVPSGGNLPNGFSGRRAFHTNSYDVNGDNIQDGPAGPSIQDRVLARQLLARHLYCLMMALNGNGNNPPNVSSPATAATTARMFAQWAINIVDFRDTDGVITGFEYDINPWNGWTVDGNLSTTNDPERGVVFGCEAPELVLSEAIALHDRRVKDTKYDVTGKERNEMQQPDDDVDQFRIPLGSLFFELYCARTHNSFTSSGVSDSLYNPHMPFELYDRSTGRLALDRTAPDGSPVWQVAIGRLRNAQDPTGFPQYQTQGQNWDDAYYADPVNPNPTLQLQYNYAGATVDIDRYVWFTNTDGGAANPRQNRVFYNADRYSAQLSPGQYMVVGPRTDTYMGSNRVNNGGGSGFWGGNSPQRITLSKANGVEVYDAMNNSTSRLSANPATADIQPTAAMAVMTRPPDTWSAAKLNDFRHWRGVNITEPLPNVVGGPVSFYPEYNTMNDGRQPIDAYDDPAAPTNTLPDRPLDNNRLIGNANMLQTRIYPDRSAIFLQRLADPTRPWNTYDNPYITVDFASVDISVFTGEEETDRIFQTDPNDPATRQTIDPDDRAQQLGGIARPGRYGTLQRAQNPQANGNMWFPSFTDTVLSPPNPIPQASGQAYFSQSIHHTFGYLNQGVGQVRDVASSGGTRAYVGDPSDTDRPFPWITWNNRPYMNAAELLLVPSSAPNRLVLEISPDNQVVPGGNSSPYSPANGTELRRPFAHLMNMFQSTAADTSMNLTRLLDYVEVPSNFVGTERWYTPDNLSAPDSPSSPGVMRPEYAPPYLYRPPFNKLSRFRDPGRININTIFEPSVWNAIVGYDAATGLNGVQTPQLQDILQSRQGYTGGTYSNPQYPTMFANPFRPADAADLMPNAANMRNHTPAEVSLFRPSTLTPNQPLFAHRSQQSANDTDRNAYFRYQGLQKLGSIITTQSNCYAVWMTVGYFEVEDNPGGPDAAHPDGFMLGQELGLDVGDTQRHRAFYLIDRSIPVGFIPGVKLNSENVVLLKRQID